MRNNRGKKLATALAVLALAAPLAACSQSGSGGDSSTPDNGTQLTMWVRSGNDVPKALVDAYNKTHKNQVKLTVVPSDGYQQKVGAAAGSNGLPDILASDVVYSPTYVKEGLFQDITSDVTGLSFYDDLAKAHIEAATLDDKIYGIPLVVDSSVLFYNKTLFSQAGLDPEVAPANFDDIYADAKAVRAIGGDTYGFYFGGNCAGCQGYTGFPYTVAAGQPPITDGGTKVHLDTPGFNDMVDLYKKMTDEGIVSSAAKNEDGSTWSASFLAGQVGILPSGSFLFGQLADAKFDWGVTGLPAPDGSEKSTFVGGDMVGVSKNSKHLTQAWDFLEWTLGDDAQVNIVSKSGNLTSRVDLADNEYTKDNPALISTVEGLATGYTPSAIGFGEIFNVPTGPWLIGLRDAIYNGKSDALATAEEAAQQMLDDNND